MISGFLGEDIEDMMTLLEHKGGDEIIHRLGKYMIEKDRKGDFGREKEPWKEAVVHAVEREGVRVWAVWGDTDAMAPKKIAESFLRKLAIDLFSSQLQSEVGPDHLLVIEGCGHFGMLEEPEKVRERGGKDQFNLRNGLTPHPIVH